MISCLLKKLKRIKRSFYLQTKNSSLEEHILNNYSKITNKQELEKERNRHNIILEDFLKKHNLFIENNIKNLLSNDLIIDIGAGSLIHTNYFSKHPKYYLFN